jgi:hypothetical protein
MFYSYVDEYVTIQSKSQYLSLDTVMPDGYTLQVRVVFYHLNGWNGFVSESG